MNLGQQYVQPLVDVYGTDSDTNETVVVGHEFSPLVMDERNFYISCAWWVSSALSE
jgi:hypothetical protein